MEGEYCKQQSLTLSHPTLCRGWDVMCIVSSLKIGIYSLQDTRVERIEKINIFTESSHFQ